MGLGLWHAGGGFAAHTGGCQKTDVGGAVRVAVGDGGSAGAQAARYVRAVVVVDFPLLEWDDETQRYYAMHHPFTSPKAEDMDKFFSTDIKVLGDVRAEAYDFVVNGVEVGGGSIRIHDGRVQSRMFEVLGFTPEEAQAQFGFLLGAFKYGAPPHGGIAFGFDRMCSLFGGSDSIRDFIAFPKNNSGRDMMIDAPSALAQAQLDELGIGIVEAAE